MKCTLNIQVDDGYQFEYEKSFKKILKLFSKEFKINQNITVDLLITNNDNIRKINNEFRSIDQSTDILSFPFGDFLDYKFMKTKPLGEIIMSYEKLVSQAEEFGHSNLREFCYMFCHGLVHLNGLDHKKNKDEEIEFNMHVDNIINLIKISR